MPTNVWPRADLEQGLGLVRLEEGDPIRVEGHEVAVDRGKAVGVPDLEVEVVDQIYLHLEPDGAEDRYEYRASGSTEGWIIAVDSDGVALNYQGFARRTYP